ncbi:MAG: penicillin-binding protein 2 [Solirubrobacteraceae bacterium]|jgi:penicillin-binding protein 2|nr:penicillin-binding protein 2 [Solirubrobacteraceae bacterium]MEA2357718.1 penicillin-binding protein 2 [Solirubrobacteraceae bacterium]
MIDPVSSPERLPPITPQLALRVAVMGGIAFVLFAIIFFRLWYLQVLSGDQYLQQARDNRVRQLRVQAPRGDIVDRNGNVLVENRVATVVTLDPERLPVAERNAAATWGQQMTARGKRPKGQRGPTVPIPAPATADLAARFERLGRVVGMSPGTIQERVVHSLALIPYASITIKVDVDIPVRNYLAERADEFPGVDVQRRYLRRYPEGSLAAQLVGTTGEIDSTELRQKRFKGVPQGTIIGKDGIERAYDQYLRGVDGSTKITVDALGRPKQVTEGRNPVSGRQLETSLDLGLQRTGQKYLAQAIGQGTGTAGAFVALDPRDGKVLALGSNPTFDPSVLSRPISQAQFDRLFGDKFGAPHFNRAIGGAYPTGSIFKPITALAGLASGVITPSTPIQDTGCIKVGAAHQSYCNAKHEALGTVTMQSAISKSSDVYFYTVGERLNALAGQPLQRWARQLGLDHTTGIDVPGEFGGNVPDAAWRDSVNRAEAVCRARKHRPCGLADGTNRPWTVGDEVNLAVGQGDLQATPLQMAVAYAAIENGGRVVRPHLGVAIQDSGGRLLQRIEPGASRQVKLDPIALQTIQAGLHEATLSGTSADVFRGWPQSQYPVFGKTGTAERGVGHRDQSWYVCYVPDPVRPIVLAVTVENGGFGAEAAAPVARTILSKWFNVPIKFIAGKSQTF